MTAIVAIERPWGCEVAADGLTTGSEYQRCSGEGMEKIVRRGGLILGAAGTGHYCEAVLAMDPPRPARSDGIEWMRRVFAPALVDHFDELGLAMNHTQDTWWEGVAALNGRIYLLDDAGCVSRPAAGVVGVGVAGPYAAGAALAGATAREAIKIAVRLDVTAGLPVTVLRQSRPRAG